MYIATPLLGFFNCSKTKPKDYFDPDLGRCLNHVLTSEIDRESIYEFGTSNPAFRYVHFPIEVKLEIEYEYGCMTYCAFNVRPKDMIKISQMTIHQLVKHKIETSRNGYDLEGFQINKYKFLITSVCVYNKKETNGNQA